MTVNESRLLSALRNLLLLVRHETDLPDCATNGVTNYSGDLDEGVVRAWEIMEEAEAAIKEAESQ